MPENRIPIPPCKVVEVKGGYRVNDAAGRAAMPDLWSPEEAQAIAERIAKGFTRAGVTSGSNSSSRV